MALQLDGIAMLGSMARHPEAFPDIAADARKAARTLVVKQLKAKRTDVPLLRQICQALAGEFSLLVDSMSDAEVKSLATKFDKHHPEVAAASASWRRQHLMALAENSAEPTQKQKAPPKAKAPRARKPAKETSSERLSSRAAGAVRKVHSDS